jgi:hypothetical protein
MERAQIKTHGLAFGRSVNTAFKSVVMYSVEHPATARAVDQAFGHLTTLLRDLPQFTFGFLNGRLLLHDLLTDEPTFRPMEADFARRGIAAVTFVANISLADFKQVLTVLAAKPKVVEEAGGPEAFLAAHPVQSARITPLKKPEGGDTVLGVDSEAYLAAGEILPPAAQARGSAMDTLLHCAQVERAFLAPPSGEEILHLAGAAAEKALLNQTDLQDVVKALARTMEEVPPERILSGLPADRQAALSGRPPEEIAAVVVEDLAVNLAAKRLAATPAGPGQRQAIDEAVQVMMAGLGMTRMVDRVLQKLGQTLKEANVPSELFENIQERLLWASLTQEERRERLLAIRQHDERSFFRLVEYIKECLQGRRVEAAVEMATHYFKFLDAEPEIVEHELSRALVVLQALVDPATVLCILGLAEYLTTELMDEGSLTPSCHAAIADTLANVSQLVTPLADLDFAHAIGSALERSLLRDRERHAACCGQALARVLPPDSAGRLVDLYMEKRADSGMGRMLAELLSWLGLVGGDVAFHRLIDETDAGSRARLLRLLTQLGPAGMEAARDHLTDERWFVVRNACVVLGDLEDPDMPRQLQGALRHADGRVQQAAVSALIKNRTSTATAALADALPGLDPHIAEFALEEILIRKDPAAVEGLERFLQASKGAKSGILGVVVNALAVVPSEHSARVLAAVLTDTSYPTPVRRAAADALLHSPLPSVRRALIAFASQASDDPIAAGLRRALERDAPQPDGRR